MECSKQLNKVAIIECFWSISCFSLIKSLQQLHKVVWDCYFHTGGEVEPEGRLLAWCHLGSLWWNLNLGPGDHAIGHCATSCKFVCFIACFSQWKHHKTAWNSLWMLKWRHSITKAQYYKRIARIPGELSTSLPCLGFICSICFCSFLTLLLSLSLSSNFSSFPFYLPWSWFSWPNSSWMLTKMICGKHV